ncbi:MULTISPECIES: class I SAM-dependent methyltransferase [unclassified Roseovarius]|uniref:class I SAM-dependent methyltransferase n=1 Tax=unclassified Roseovarius TaxID=2614913 RepID=UPI00273EA7F8|nr:MULTISPECIES: class I SAM-dependent methyltransferase [unclassified Roseovarius]
MSAARLSLALETGEITLPDTGRIAVFGPRGGVHDLSGLPLDRLHVLTGFKPDVDYFSARGLTCATLPEGRYSASVVFLPRAKRLARGLIARTMDVTDGPVIVDGAKTDGVESILKDCRKRTEVSPPLSKAHGKLFSLTPPGEFDDWAIGAPQQIDGGFVTQPGVFSADAIDPGSRLLADTLPAKLGAHVADLGGGWGYLSTRILEREAVAHLDLVEADHAALECARQNVSDPRLRLHWDDATRWRPDELLDCVVTNPPFHTDRSADPGLGQAFIAAAAAMLKPSGQLWLVANRHLPYEPNVSRLFATVTEAAGDNRFKILHAQRPSRKAR